MFIKEIWRHPIKGCAGERLSIALIHPRGVHLDRQWMVVDERGMFVTQRSSGQLGVGIRSMCLVRVTVPGDGFVLAQAPHMPDLVFPVITNKPEACSVQVWNWQVKAIEVSRACSDWFTEYLSREKKGTYRLVQIAHHEERFAKTGNAQLGFADGFPFMIMSEATLAALNAQEELVGNPVRMNRFRPTLVLSDCLPHAEDTINLMIARGIVFRGQKLCDRCNVPAFEQETGIMDSRPLQALARYRRWSTEEGEKPKIWVGRNFVHHGTGYIYEGDRIEYFE
jgi:hypothetical protein